MEAPKESRFFPLQPYYIPGYEGFIPQYKYQCGETFGRTTHKLLTDPSEQKSPRSVLAPLSKQKVDEDSSGMKGCVQSYISDHPGAATNIPDPVLEPRPPAARPGLDQKDLVTMDTDLVPWHDPGEYVPRPQLPHGYIQRTSRHSASEEQGWRLPEITPASGRGRSYGPGRLCGACGGRNPLAKIEVVTLPGVEEITDVKRKWLPNLDVPNTIQQKVIPGYAGFIPRLIWFNGMSYNRCVKEAMREFDKYQRNQICRLGNRYPQSYWPNKQIYTSAGLIPAYAGFVPYLRDTYGLTFGNSTRKAYENE